MDTVFNEQTIKLGRRIMIREKYTYILRQGAGKWNFLAAKRELDARKIDILYKKNGLHFPHALQGRGRIYFEDKM